MVMSSDVMKDWNMHPIQLLKNHHFRDSNSVKYELSDT
jgi:hypothetical protein